MPLKKMGTVLFLAKVGSKKNRTVPFLSLKAFTLLEIIVSLVILSIVIAGLANVMVLGKRFILHSRSRRAGAELSMPLQMQVRWDEWQLGANCLSSNPTSGCPAGPVQIGGIDYNPTWSITPIAGTAMRRVSITWTWAER